MLGTSVASGVVTRPGLATRSGVHPGWIAQLRLTWLLFKKELREMFVGRTLWAMLIVGAPLVGFSFQQSVYLYSEASKSALRLPNLASGLVPLDGIVAPTFGAIYLLNTFLFPFLAIRSIGGERQHGGLKLLLQLPISPARLVAVKVLALGVCWTLALVPALLGMLFWMMLGGHLQFAELLTVIAGHGLYALVIAGVAFLTAALTDSIATAAILTLAVTLGSWALDFAGATQAGLVHSVAGFSLTASLRTLERGLLSTPQMLVPAILALTCLAVSAVWLPTGVARRGKLIRTAIALTVAIASMVLVIRFPAYADISENRRNSFNPADERALRALDQVLHVTVYLAPTDSRRQDLEINVLSKLQRIVPHMVMDEPDAGTSGLFGGTPSDTYGKVQFDYAGQSVQSRATSAREILPLIYGLAGEQVTPDPVLAYPGYILVADARGLVWWFYILLPALAFAGWRLSQRAPSVAVRLTPRRTTGIPSWAKITLGMLVTTAVIQTAAAVYISRRTARQQTGIVITLRDDGFTPKTFTIDGGEGQRYVMTLVNAGSEPHQWAIDGLNVRSGVVPPGQNGTIDFVPNREGTYRVVDPLPGHEQAGLVGYITVD
ncbi:MAG: cupredoxin domain-containing protein [Chloroflexi bacterium]|nr:cupredoxin domain-containing protein [Chloroflexota bacterium]